jgi:tetratricopeptide (TPR) repeat protein
MTAGNQNPGLLEKSLSLKNALFRLCMIALLIIAVGLYVLTIFPPNSVSGNMQESLWLESAQKKVKENPKDVEALVRLGNVHLTMENNKDAMSWYKKAFALAPQSPLVRYHLALGFRLRKNIKML